MSDRGDYLTRAEVPADELAALLALEDACRAMVNAGASQRHYVTAELAKLDALRSQPPLASSVVADEATAGEGKGSPPPPRERCPKLVHSAAGQLRCVLHAGHSNCHSYDCQERHEAQRHLGKCLKCSTRLTNEPSPLTGEEGKAERVDANDGALAYARAALKNSSKASQDGAPDVAFRELRIAVRHIAEHLEVREAQK